MAAKCNHVFHDAALRQSSVQRVSSTGSIWMALSLHPGLSSLDYRVQTPRPCLVSPSLFQSPRECTLLMPLPLRKDTQDAVAAIFAEHMSLGRSGPDKRAERNSFLREISAEQMASYTPAQLATILSQRDGVGTTLGLSYFPTGRATNRLTREIHLKVHETIARTSRVAIPPTAKPWVPGIWSCLHVQNLPALPPAWQRQGMGEPKRSSTRRYCPGHCYCILLPVCGR